MYASPFGEWKEITKRKEGFQALVAVLVDFDERTARYRRYGDPEQHFFRKAIALADPDDLRVFVRKLRGYVYFVVAEVRTECGFCATSWVHEDGVQLERDQLSSEPEHPVHGVNCLSDYYRRYSESFADDIEEVSLSDSTIDLMFSEIGWTRPPFVA